MQERGCRDLVGFSLDRVEIVCSVVGLVIKLIVETILQDLPRPRLYEVGRLHGVALPDKTQGASYYLE